MPSFITHMLSIWNVAAILLVLAMTVIAVVRWKSIPRELPNRYDMDGRPESWTDRRVVWFYPIIALVLIVFVAAADGEKMAPLSLFFVAVLLFQMLRTLAIGDRRADRLPPWFYPIVTFGVIGLVLFLSLT
jgi:hypothetical protein